MNVTIVIIAAIAIGLLLILSGICCFRWNKNQRYHKELDELLSGVANNAANNYKDAAQKDFKAFLEKFDELKAEEELNERQLNYYEGMKTRYEQELKGFHH